MHTPTFRRHRILRKNKNTLALTSETEIRLSDFIAPLFVEEGSKVATPIPSLEGHYRYSLDKALYEVEQLMNIGVVSCLLFVKVGEDLKDNQGKEAVNPNGLMQKSIREIKKRFPELVLMTDVALDPYSIYGHDGVVANNEIVNDETIKILAQMAVSHAEAGVDFVAPSDMMDGRVSVIRSEFEKNNIHNVGILSYSAKYASCLYGPFRDALDSAPGFGDKKTYQMNPANRREGVKEALSDVEEGADIVMVKPALSYLDVIRDIAQQVNIPVAAYHVSGEYAMIHAAAEKGWLDYDLAAMEATLSIKRAGADMIASYFIKDIARILGVRS